MPKPTYYLFLSFLLVSGIGFSQSNGQLKELNELDSIAYASLASNGAEIEEKANNLLEAGIAANSSVHQINAYTLLGILNKNKGYYVTSVEFYHQALEVAEAADDVGRVSVCYNNIGSVYQIQKNHTKALHYFKKSLELEDELNNPLQKSIRLYNIGDIYREMDSLSLALTNFNSSLLIEREHGNNEGIIYAMLGVADIYLKLDKISDAEITLEKSEAYLDDSFTEPKILYYMLMADLFSEKDEFDRALKQLNYAKKISETRDFNVHLADINEKGMEIRVEQESKVNRGPSGNSTALPINLSWIYYPLSVIVLILLVFLFRRSWKKRFMDENPKTPETNEIHFFHLLNDSGKTRLKIPLDLIICFEANDNYVITYYLTESNELQKSMERASLKKVEELISDYKQRFFRVHKSYVINKSFIESIGGKSQAYKIQMQFVTEAIPVSRNFDIDQVSQ